MPQEISFGTMALEASVELQLVMVYLSLFLVSDHQASLVPMHFVAHNSFKAMDNDAVTLT